MRRTSGRPMSVHRESHVDVTARRFDTGQIVRVRTTGDRLAQVDTVHDSDASTLSADLPWLAPGFIDIQVNGYRGQEFSSPELTPEKVASIVRDHYAFGVTGICPTLTTQSLATLEHGVRAIAGACEK